MLFITNPHFRKLEAFMQEIPHFPPKGSKVDFDSLEDEILLFEIENVIVNVKLPNENLNISSAGSPSAQIRRASCTSKCRSRKTAKAFSDSSISRNADGRI